MNRIISLLFIIWNVSSYGVGYGFSGSWTGSVTWADSPPGCVISFSLKQSASQLILGERTVTCSGEVTVTAPANEFEIRNRGVFLDGKWVGHADERIIKIVTTQYTFVMYGRSLRKPTTEVDLWHPIRLPDKVLRVGGKVHRFDFQSNAEALKEGTRFLCTIKRVTNQKWLHSGDLVSLDLSQTEEQYDLEFRHPDGTFINWPCHPFFEKFKVLPESDQIALKAVHTSENFSMFNTLEIEKNEINGSSGKFPGWLRITTEYGDGKPGLYTNAYLICTRQ